MTASAATVHLNRFWTWTEKHGSGAYFFRGQADGSDIVPKVARPDYQYSLSRERALFNAFKSQARPFLRTAVVSDWEWLALAQHHGAPTRLVDWSTSPLVAAWFAVTSFPLHTDAYVFALDVARPGLESVDSGTGQVSSGATIIDPLGITRGLYLMETSPVSSRITTQRGLFTVHGDPRKPLAIPKDRRFEIPAGMRLSFQLRLLDLGIDAAHIYPDLDGLCKSLDWRMRTGKGFSAVT
ncbi:MAG TPA: FRG domain-containing protein [Allosphingosinicella sp.]|jgi:hypothetical protein